MTGEYSLIRDHSGVCRHGFDKQHIVDEAGTGDVRLPLWEREVCFGGREIDRDTVLDDVEALFDSLRQGVSA